MCRKHIFRRTGKTSLSIELKNILEKKYKNLFCKEIL